MPNANDYAGSIYEMLYVEQELRYFSCVSTISAILQPDADGSLHLPLPPELRGAAVRVTATLEAVSVPAVPRFGCLAGMIEVAPDFDEPLEDFKDYTL